MNQLCMHLETLDVNAVLKGQGADPAVIEKRNPSLKIIAQTALDLGMPLIEPAYFRKSETIIIRGQNEILIAGNLQISSKKIAEILFGAEAVELVICTIGDKLEKLSMSLFASDATLALALDGLANAAIDQLTESVCCAIDLEAQAEGLKSSLPISPGSEDWPLQFGQPALFKTIKPDQAIILLNESFLMIPKKSASFFVGIGRKLSEKGKTCDFCNVRETCRYRLRKNI